MKKINYQTALEIEFYLRRVLNVAPGGRTDQQLDHLFDGILHYESGYRMITPSAHKQRIESVRKYFTKALEKLTKKYRLKGSETILFHEDILCIQTFFDIQKIYYHMKKLEG